MARPKNTTISKMEAVRQAITTLGKDAPLLDVIKFIKQNFNVEMSRAMAYTYKSAAIKQVAGKRRGRKPGRKAAPIANGRKAIAITLEDIQAVKALTDRIGAEKVRQLAAVLAK